MRSIGPKALGIALCLSGQLAVHAAAAPGSDAEWAHWATERRHSLYHDADREVAHLKSMQADARQRGDAHLLWLATGSLLMASALGEFPEADFGGIAREAEAQLPAARQAQDPLGLFSLLLGLAQTKVENLQQSAAQALLDEAGTIASAVALRGMHAEVDALLAGERVYGSDPSMAQQLVQKVYDSDADQNLKLIAFMTEVLARVLTLTPDRDWKALLASIDDRLAHVDAEDEPYMALALASWKINVLRKVARPAEAAALLQHWIDFARVHQASRVQRDFEFLLVQLNADQQNWQACVQMLENLSPRGSSATYQVEFHMMLGTCKAGLQDKSALDEVREIDAQLPVLKNSPALLESVYGSESKIHRMLGDYKGAYDALLLSRNAGVKKVAQANEANRQELQAVYETAAKERENEALKSRQELLERRRSELVAGLSAAILALVVLGLLFRAQFLQRRRLAVLSGELSQAHDDIQKVNADLTALNASRTRLLAAACHDLRQPAHALGLLAESAVAEAGPEARDSMDGIRRCSTALSDMLDMLLDMTRLESERYRPRFSAFPLHEILDEIRLQFASAAAHKGLGFFVDTPAVVVRSDRHLLRRMLLNLVSNAIKYTGAGKVSVLAVVESRQVRIRVEDSGPGIAQDQREAIFEEYVRLDNGAHLEGLGIGLSIVRRAAQLLHCSLSLESAEGVGTTVTLQIPLLAGEANVAHVAAPAPGQGKVVAVIDDDETIQGATRKLLALHGFVTVAGGNIDEITRDLARLGRSAPDLLVSDLHIAGQDGLDLIQTLRTDIAWNESSFVLLTGDLDPEVATRAAAGGILLAYKPVLPLKLLETVNLALEEQRASRSQEEVVAASGVNA